MNENTLAWVCMLAGFVIGAAIETLLFGFTQISVEWFTLPCIGVILGMGVAGICAKFVSKRS